MKKTLSFGIIAGMALMFSSCMSPMATTSSSRPMATGENVTKTTQTSSQATTQSSTTTASSNDALGTLLNGVIGTASESGNLGSAIGNIIASVTGSYTTTQANLVGTWTYTAPSVQFESENLLTQAGGATAASSIESKLVNVYKMVGISQGKMVVTFTNANTMTITFSGRTISGTYSFNSSAKTVTLTTTAGLSLTAYVTISGNNMSLCFDSSKLLSLVSLLGTGNTQNSLSSLSSLASSFSGMKTGFKFTR